MDYSVNQVAEKLNVSTETVRRWIRSGQLYATRLGGRSGYKISQDEFNKFLRKRNLELDNSLDSLESSNLISLLQDIFNYENKDISETINNIGQRYLLEKELIDLDEKILNLKRQRNEVKTKLELLSKNAEWEEKNV